MNVHPEYLVTEDSWDVVRAASNWREGVLPGPGGLQDQSAWMTAAVELVLSTWNTMRAAQDKKRD